MNWFNKWFYKKCEEAWNYARQNAKVEKETIAGSYHRTPKGPSEGFNFTVMPATGGMVVEFKHYDINTDRNKTNLYVIHDDQEHMFEELAKIVAMEYMKR